MEFTASLKFLRIAPRKVRLLADAMRGRPVPLVLRQLAVTRKSSAEPLRKLVASAVASASRKEVPAERLIIATITVDEGPKLKRFRPRAFGRAAEILKRSSHISLMLRERPDANAKPAKVKRDKSKTDSAAVKQAETKKTERPKTT